MRAETMLRCCYLVVVLLCTFNSYTATPIAAAAAGEIAKALPEIIKEFRKGNPVLDNLDATYDRALSLYGKIASTTFEKRTRTLELLVVNGMDKTLEYTDSFFDSGTFFRHPKPIDIEPGGAAILFVSNRQAAPTGVTGGVAYKIKRGGGRSLYIGFTNPLLGGYKTFVTVDKGKSAEWAYEKAVDDSFKRGSTGGYEWSGALRDAKEGGDKRFEFVVVHEQRG